MPMRNVEITKEEHLKNIQHNIEVIASIISQNGINKTLFRKGSRILFVFKQDRKEDPIKCRANYSGAPSGQRIQTLYNAKMSGESRISVGETTLRRLVVFIRNNFKAIELKFYDDIKKEQKVIHLDDLSFEHLYLGRLSSDPKACIAREAPTENDNVYLLAAPAVELTARICHTYIGFYNRNGKMTALFLSIRKVKKGIKAVCISGVSAENLNMILSLIRQRKNQISDFFETLLQATYVDDVVGLGYTLAQNGMLSYRGDITITEDFAYSTLTAIPYREAYPITTSVRSFIMPIRKFSDYLLEHCGDPSPFLGGAGQSSACEEEKKAIKLNTTIVGSGTSVSITRTYGSFAEPVLFALFDGGDQNNIHEIDLELVRDLLRGEGAEKSTSDDVTYASSVQKVRKLLTPVNSRVFVNQSTLDNAWFALLRDARYRRLHRQQEQTKAAAKQAVAARRQKQTENP